MRLLLVCFSMLLSGLARADSFSGRWLGTGSIDLHLGTSPINTDVDITILQTDRELTLLECWMPQGPEVLSDPQCIDAVYEVRNDSQIYFNSRKVGDIFPHRIVIFDGTSLVSEQVLIERVNAQKIRYQYSYTNMDGANDHRTAVLSLRP